MHRRTILLVAVFASLVLAAPAAATPTPPQARKAAVALLVAVPWNVDVTIQLAERCPETGHGAVLCGLRVRWWSGGRSGRCHVEVLAGPKTWRYPASRFGCPAYWRPVSALERCPGLDQLKALSDRGSAGTVSTRCR